MAASHGSAPSKKEEGGLRGLQPGKKKEEASESEEEEEDEDDYDGIEYSSGIESDNDQDLIME